MFLIYGGEKELVVNGCVDASFDTDPDNSMSTMLCTELIQLIAPTFNMYPD